MAIKTLILRPISSTANTSGTVAGSPADTPLEECYLLLNEESPDDDGTYVVITAAAVRLSVGFNIPDNIVPTSLKVKFRAKTSSSNTDAKPDIVYPIGDGTTQSWQPEVANFDVYEDYAIPIETFAETWTRFKTDSLALTVKTPVNSKSATEVRYTQVYLEVTYDDGGAEPDPTPINITLKKVGGVWTECTATYYKKQNNEWINVTAEDLSESQYPSVYIT